MVELREETHKSLGKGIKSLFRNWKECGEFGKKYHQQRKVVEEEGTALVWVVILNTIEGGANSGQFYIDNGLTLVFLFAFEEIGY